MGNTLLLIFKWYIWFKLPDFSIMSNKSAAITFLDFYIFWVFFGSVQNEDSGRVKGESSEVKILLSLCKGVELDFTSLFPLPRVLSKLSPGFLPSRTSPPSTLTTLTLPPITCQHTNQVSFILMFGVFVFFVMIRSSEKKSRPAASRCSLTC